MKNKPQFFLWLRTVSVLIDFMLILSLGHLLNLLLSLFFDVSYLIMFMIIYPSYYFLCYWFLHGRTFGKLLTGLQVVSNNLNGVNKAQLFIREIICKYLILFIVPLILTGQISFPINPFLLYGTVGYFLFLIVLLFVYPFFSRKGCWESVSSTITIKNTELEGSLKHKSMIFLASVYLMTISLKIYPFIIEPQDIKFKFHPKYANSDEIKNYTNFVLNHPQDPIDYVFGLFQKYDLVVLCERIHSEYTQYELIANIIRDKRFSEKVGSIYTECGSRSFQDTLNNYLITNFANEDSLNKATALLQRNSNSVWPLWTNTNLFFLLKTVHNLNSNLADSLKINWYFTDIPTDWQTLTPSNYQKHKRKLRDNGMANYIYNIYKDKLTKHEKRQKGLVIMNFRHGFGHMVNKEITPVGSYPESVNAAAILIDSLPGKVCNVLLNTISFKYGYLFTPIQKGKWDRVFDELNNQNTGFNFVGSPFGKDEFDMNIGKQVSGVRYQDIFNGFIFYKPLKKHMHKTGFPYMLYNFEDSLIKRAKCVSPEYAEKWKEQIKNYKTDNIRNGLIQHASLVNLCNGKAEYATLYNLVFNIGFSIITFLVLIIALINYKTRTD